jgi:glycosyltransferase involved in cell wall biosynthesis
VEGELVLVGRVAPELEEPVAEHVRRGSVRSVGFRRHVGPYFRAADVFVFPTLEEGGPQVTYEAAGCGLPVVTTPMGAARLVEPNRTGVVVAPGSVDELAAALELMAARPDLRTRYGAEARRSAARFSYSAVGVQRAHQLARLVEARHP